MKFARVNGERLEALPKLLGSCPACNQPMLAKCGKERVWHWAHLGRFHCDHWWENETQWHRAWKAEFPVDWQEVVHYAETGEKHISDVKTDRGWVLEFQHSYLKPEERRSRDGFYPRLIWVVDGTRRKRDEAQLLKVLNGGSSVGGYSSVRRVFTDGCALLRDWADTNSPVFLDFGAPQVLWWIFAKTADSWAYVAPYSRAAFIESHRSGARRVAQEFEEFVKDVPELVGRYEAHLRLRRY